MTEVLKQALEALQFARDQIVDPEYHPIGWGVSRLDEVLSIGKQALAAQPAQEPASVTYKEVQDSMNALEKGNLYQQVIAEELGQRKLYTTSPAAQPAQEPMCPECKAGVLYECVACSSNNYPPQGAQKPVMYGIQRADGSYGNWVWSQKSHAETDIPENPAGFGYKVIGYYTAPLAQPAQERTWVDLTDDEIDKWTPEIHGVIRAVLAQFKEKNNG